MADTSTGYDDLRNPHRHDDCLACRTDRYRQAQEDPVAAVVLAAMHEQDAATYNGLSDDMGQKALDAAAKIREALGAEFRESTVSAPNGNGALPEPRRVKVCPTRTPEPHELGEFPMTCYRCHVEADS